MSLYVINPWPIHVFVVVDLTTRSQACLKRKKENWNLINHHISITRSLDDGLDLRAYTLTAVTAYFGHRIQFLKMYTTKNNSNNCTKSTCTFFYIEKAVIVSINLLYNTIIWSLYVIYTFKGTSKMPIAMLFFYVE